jgi:hydroxymethylpyrimidine/phosphomethylpyrimidine kinase
MIHTILTIAGSDSSGGAGIQADIKAIAANGGYAVTVITSVTAQNTTAVFRSDDLPPEAVQAQLSAVFDDFEIAAAKTGMLPSARIVECVADGLRQYDCPNLVVDPVMVAKSGYRLSDDDSVEMARRLLFPLARVVTPNAEEAARLTGRRVATLDNARDAARALMDAGCRAVVVKGGHLEDDHSTDILYDGSEFFFYPAERLPTKRTHGTGCTFSAALATFLGQGQTLSDAVAATKAYVVEAIRHGLPLGRGHGPTNAFWRWFPT